MSETRDCPFCAEEIKAAAIKCKHCGEFLEKSKAEGPPCPDCGAPTSPNSSFCPHCGLLITDSGPAPADDSSRPSRPLYRPHSKMAAALLAIFLGGVGLHKFYLGQTALGVLYLLTCWTFIPAIAGLIEGLNFLIMSEELFDERYNNQSFG